MIKNGVEYSDYELDVLREYAGREKILKDFKNDSLADFLGIASNGNAEVNTYLATGRIPITVKTINQLKDFLEKIRKDVGNMTGWGIPSLIDEYYTRMPKYEQQKNKIISTK